MAGLGLNGIVIGAMAGQAALIIVTHYGGRLPGFLPAVTSPLCHAVRGLAVASSIKQGTRDGHQHDHGLLRKRLPGLYFRSSWHSDSDEIRPHALVGVGLRTLLILLDWQDR